MVDRVHRGDRGVLCDRQGVRPWAGWPCNTGCRRWRCPTGGALRGSGWGVIEPGRGSRTRVAGASSAGAYPQATIASRAYQTRLEGAGLPRWAQACPHAGAVVDGRLGLRPRRKSWRAIPPAMPGIDALIRDAPTIRCCATSCSAWWAAGVTLVDSAEATAEAVAAAWNPRLTGRVGPRGSLRTGDSQYAFAHTAKVSAAWKGKSSPRGHRTGGGVIRAQGRA